MPSLKVPVPERQKDAGVSDAFTFFACDNELEKEYKMYHFNKESSNTSKLFQLRTLLVLELFTV